MVTIKNREVLVRISGAELLLDAIETALKAADPYNAVMSKVKLRGDYVEVEGKRVEVRGRIHVLGFGKASARMAEALVEIFGDLIAGGVVITPTGGNRVGPVEVLKGNHPIPGEDTLKASKRLLEYLQGVGEGDVVFVAISGGGSALFEVPEEGVELGEIAKLSDELMGRGADIVELNAVRKRLSAVKGGKLLRYIKARRVVSLIVSDVVGDRLDTIASGPTAPDATDKAFAVAVLKKYGLWDSLPERLRRLIEIETPKAGDPLFDKVINVPVVNNLGSLQKAAERLALRGYNTIILTSMLEGEAREVGRVLASVIKSAALHGFPASRPVAILAGGETVVTVRGRGRGGRNQEMCLSLAMAIRGLNATAACVATDGIDGNSPAAGALIDGGVVEEAERLGVNPAEYLDNNDSYTFFEKLGRAIITGYTGVNVNDIFLAVVDKDK
ncbi:glycerate kinase [Pyrobaculum sp.]|uniref:glycerate kinase type-2 family protein n=1 Tax=Pyrobaculum sp. TaxID=2004705 RepID=UPI00315F0652